MVWAMRSARRCSTGPIARRSLPVAWNAMIVTADPYSAGVQVGDRVRAIDGVSDGAVLAKLIELARADGHKDAKRRRLMSVQGEDRPPPPVFTVNIGIST